MLMTYLGRGIAHEQLGLPCQDHIGCVRTEEGCVIAAISDGASSARFAQEAADLTVRTVLDWFSRTPLEELLKWPEQELAEQLVEECAERLEEAGRRYGEPDLRQFSATMVFAVIGQDRILTGNLGDGCVVVLDDRGDVLVNTAREQSKPCFTISESAVRQLRLNVLDRAAKRVDLVMLISDGPREMLRGRGRGDLAASVRMLWTYARQKGMVHNDALAQALGEMVQLPVERMDDWSVVIWGAGEPDGPVPPAAVPRSMLQEEQVKFEHRCAEKTSDRKEG